MPTYHAIVTWSKTDGTSTSRLHTVTEDSIAHAALKVEEECRDLPYDARTTMISEKRETR